MKGEEGEGTHLYFSGLICEVYPLQKRERGRGGGKQTYL